MSKYFKRAVASVIAAGAVFTSGLVSAQTGAAPKDLQWKPMAMVGFNTGKLSMPLASRVEMDLARHAWGKEIESTPLNLDRNGRLPSFILLSIYSVGGSQFTFSIFDAANAEGCTPPANGRGVVDMYSLCPMRVSQFVNEKTQTREYQNYCHLFTSSDTTSNQTQMAFDEKSMTAYFRVIQQGKHVKACDRALKIN